MAIKRTAKGKRPVFVSGDIDANLNRLLTMVSALAAEVAVLRDRQRTLEQLLAQRGDVSLVDIEEFEPDVQDLAERAEWQAEYLRRVHYVFERGAEEEADRAESSGD